MSFIQPEEALQELYYSYTFSEFLNHAAGPVRKFMLNGDVTYTRDIVKYIYGITYWLYKCR